MTEENESKKRPDKVILLKHEFSKAPEKEGEGESEPSTTDTTSLSEQELKFKLQERESQLAVLGLKEFDRHKAELLSKFPESRRKQLSKWVEDNPDRLEQLRGSLIASGEIEDDDLGDGTSKVPPDGTATAYNPKEASRGSTHRDPTVQFISDLYNIQNSPTASKAEKDEADRALDSMFEGLELGLEKRPRRGKDRDYSFDSVTHCPKCGTTISGATANLFSKGKAPCPACSYDHKRPLKKPYLQPK